jgi:hypothetical protein
LQHAGGGCWDKHQFDVQQAIEFGICWTACLQATEPPILQFAIAVPKTEPHFQRDLRSEYIFGGFELAVILNSHIKYQEHLISHQRTILSQEG